MKSKISKRTVDQLSPGSWNLLLWDCDVKGFGVRCRASGAKYYFVKMRIGRRQRWITIGRHGSPWTPEAARREALRLLGLKAAGKDPATERDDHNGGLTVAELASRFLNEHVAHSCKRLTAEEYRRVIGLYICPSLGRHRVTELTRADVVQLHHQLRDRPYQANRCLAVLSKMSNLAEAWGLRPDGSNPCRHVKKYREEKRERYLTNEELQRLGMALAQAERTKTENPFVLAAIGLLILTGARLNEILTLRWEHVDLANGLLRLPDSKTGPKDIFLNEAAASLLREIPRIVGNPHVIAGKKAGAPLVNLHKRWRSIRAAANLHGVRIHDLRHSFASVAAGAGMSLPVIGKLLGHSQPSTTARYAHLAPGPIRAASNLIGSEISAAMNGPAGRVRVGLGEDSRDKENKNHPNRVTEASNSAGANAASDPPLQRESR
jgi:integrase